LFVIAAVLLSRSAPRRVATRVAREQSRVTQLPELKQRFPEAPFIPRPGQINAWDNEDFVKAVKATGRKQLIIAGVMTGV
jgi:nicotinamidase-related amidase